MQGCACRWCEPRGGHGGGVHQGMGMEMVCMDGIDMEVMFKEVWAWRWCACRDGHGSGVHEGMRIEVVCIKGWAWRRNMGSSQHNCS